MVWEQIFTEESGDQMKSKKASKLGNISYTFSIHYTVCTLLCSMYIKKIYRICIYSMRTEERIQGWGGGGGFQWYKIKFLKFSALFPGTLHFKSKFYLGTFFFPQFENT